MLFGLVKQGLKCEGDIFFSLLWFCDRVALLLSRELLPLRLYSSSRVSWA
jgi:hypothetical protein